MRHNALGSSIWTEEKRGLAMAFMEGEREGAMAGITTATPAPLMVGLLLGH